MNEPNPVKRNLNNSTNFGNLKNNTTIPKKRREEEYYDDEAEEYEQPRRKKVVYETEYVERHRDEGGGFGIPFGCSFRMLSCGGCLIFLGIIIFGFYVVFSKPTSVWGHVVDYLNNDVVVPEMQSNKSIDEIKNNVDGQITALKDNRVVITESDLSILADSNIEGLKDLSIDIEDGSMKIFWVMDRSIDDKPLYGVVALSSTDGQSQIDKIGTERVGLPSFVNEFMTKNLLKVLQIKDKERTDSLLLELIGIDKNFSVKRVDFSKDQMEIIVDTNVSLTRK